MAGDNASSISDETRITIRKRVMVNYMRRKRRAIESDHNSLKLVREIARVDPFDVFPIKFEPYMFDLLKYCKRSPLPTLASVLIVVNRHDNSLEKFLHNRKPHVTQPYDGLLDPFSLL